MTGTQVETTPKFTKDQLAAMDVSGPSRNTCVVAGPGSGKTTVLVEHFKRLVEAGVDPLRILAITFTEKAAGNMRAKLAEAFQHDPPVRARLERAWVSTVHGFCGRMLRENAVFAGIDPEFAVADARQAWRIQQQSMSAAMEAVFAEKPKGVRALIRGLSSPEFEQAVLSAYDAMRGAGTRVEELDDFPAPSAPGMAQVANTLYALAHDPLPGWSPRQRAYLKEVLEAGARIVNAAGPLEALRAIEEFRPSLKQCKSGTEAYEVVRRLRDTEVKELTYALITEYYAPERALLLEILRRFDTTYRERKRQADLLDFADLEEFAVRLLVQEPEACARLRAQFDRVLMDEFQDTNGQQARLLELVRPPNRFYAVGDINQSIFGFRHAEPEGFREYRGAVERGGGRVVELMANFRSRPEILRAVETIMGGADGIEPHRLTASKEFEPEADGAPPVEVMAVTGQDAASALSMEAQWVARRIVELVEGGAAFEDVAVLVRNTEVIGTFTAAFDEAQVPYTVNCGRGFYESREVVDLTHLLRAIANPRDEISLAAVLRSPLAAVSDEALLRLKMRGPSLGAALAHVADQAEGFDSSDLAKLTRFRERLREWRSRREDVSFDRLLAAALDDCGYRPESPGNLDKFLAEARAAGARMTLDEFVEEMEMVRAENPREPDPPPEDATDAVKVMTVHSAKGLEFPIVFVAALQKGVDSDPPVVAFSRHTGLGARWRNPGSTAVGRAQEKDDSFQHAIRAERSAREDQEANRLLYVAMTRAERRLLLTFSGNGKRAQNWAELVSAALGVDPATPVDKCVMFPAQDGMEWPLRILVADRPPELRLAPAPKSEPGATVEMDWLPAPEIDGQHDGNATATGLAEFARCPRRYFLAHYIGFEGRQRARREEADGDRELPAGEFGTQVHELLAEKRPAEGADPEAVRLAEVFRNGRLGRRLASATRVEREFDFLLAIDGLVVRGQIDLWFEEGGRTEIVDYKTDAVSAAEAAKRAREYALQLRIYAMAIERMTGRAPDRAWLHFLRPDVVVEIDLAPSLLDSPEQALAEFADAQANMEFPLREGEHCAACPYYKGLCPAGRTS
jgi:ATP-dependent helicase/nuclease subunit A